jgi:hypothetical protein
MLRMAKIFVMSFISAGAERSRERSVCNSGKFESSGETKPVKECRTGLGKIFGVAASAGKSSFGRNFGGRKGGNVS